ncbi:hypothetical protein EV421DRAFT_1856109 [Armillaria borealis]|uniref:Uncharacterized protein n=1 Tax=Armillaria borealis TaxID=47425 RepID=A0AA39IWK5_9AGAR|nr:hypothetical protein EV421DRAFT_1856109 [Armillaria borealis]
MPTAVRVASSLRGRRLLTLVSKVLTPVRLHGYVAVTTESLLWSQTASRRRMAQDTDRASVATTVVRAAFDGLLPPIIDYGIVTARRQL